MQEPKSDEVRAVDKIVIVAGLVLLCVLAFWSGVFSSAPTPAYVPKFHMGQCYREVGEFEDWEVRPTGYIAVVGKRKYLWWPTRGGKALDSEIKSFDQRHEVIPCKEGPR